MRWNFRFNIIKDLKEPDLLPDISIAPGFNGFYGKSFIEKFKLKNIFKSIPEKELNSLWIDFGIIDKKNHYTILAFNPTVFLINNKVKNDLPVPDAWADLLKPEYKKKLAIRGTDKKTEDPLKMEFCEGILFNYYKEHGESGVKKLAATVGWSLHPSEMIKLSKSHKPDVPFVSAIPYSFAKLVKDTNNLSIVFPKDGLILNPITLLIKNKPDLFKSRMIDFLLSPQVAQLFSDVGFISMYKNSSNDLPENIKYKWLGWDFIENNNLDKLKIDLNKLFLENYK